MSDTKETPTTASEQITPKLRHDLFVEFFHDEPGEVTASTRRAFISLLSRINPDSYEAHDVVLLSKTLTYLEELANECRA